MAEGLLNSTFKNAVDIMLPDNGKSMNYAIEKAINSTPVNFPAVVEDVNEEKDLVLVKIPVRRATTEFGENGERAFDEYSKVVCPIKRNFAGGVGFYFPVKKGDTGWVKSADIDVSAWRGSDGFPETVNPDFWESHRLDWGYFEPDTIKKTFNLIEGANGALCIQTIDGKGGVMLFPDGKMQIILPQGLTIFSDIQINGNVNINGTLTNNGVNHTTHTHGGVQTGSGSTGQPK